MFYMPKSKAEQQKLASTINSAHVSAMSTIYDTIFDSFAPNFGKLLSKKERSEKKLYDTALIYGEIDYDSFGAYWGNSKPHTHSIIFALILLALQA